MLMQQNAHKNEFSNETAFFILTDQFEEQLDHLKHNPNVRKMIFYQESVQIFPTQHASRDVVNATIMGLADN